uniref:Uncharacterized protein n=1 Tax=Cucumis melo TaxID=3656 RepID=A0A9I9EH67_CUCME
MPLQICCCHRLQHPKTCCCRLQHLSKLRLQPSQRRLPTSLCCINHDASFS